MQVLNVSIPLWGVLVFVVSYYVFSAAVGAMEAPVAEDSHAYRFWFRFLNRLAANWTRAAVALKVPGAQANEQEG